MRTDPVKISEEKHKGMRRFIIQWKMRFAKNKYSLQSLDPGILSLHQDKIVMSSAQRR